MHLQKILSIASENAQTLYLAIVAAELERILDGNKDYTVFAPVDDAFVLIQRGVTALMKPENKLKLARIINYHIVPGKHSSTTFKVGTELKTLQ